MTKMLGALLLVVTSTGLLAQNHASTPAKQEDTSVASRLRGTWRLVSYGTILPDGTLEPVPGFGPHPIGYLMYDATAHMCVSLANPDHPRWANPQKPTDAEKLHSYDVMFAYCGTYEVQEEKHRIVHRPEMASLPHFVGSDQLRLYRFEGNRLILTQQQATPTPDFHPHQVTWERVGP